MRSKKQYAHTAVSLALRESVIKRIQNHTRYKSLDISVALHRIIEQYVDSPEFSEIEKDAVISRLTLENVRLTFKQTEVSAPKPKTEPPAKTTAASEPPPAPTKPGGERVH